MTLKSYVVYGRKTYDQDENGNWTWTQHRQAVSFQKSRFWMNDDGSFVSVCNSDIIDTNDYTILVIGADSLEKCREILEGQLSDGVFENYNYGEVEEL